jgi:hypothetical protein
MKNITLKKGTKYLVDCGWCTMDYRIKENRTFKVIKKRKDNWETKDKKADDYIKFRLKFREYAFVKKDKVKFTDDQEYYAGTPYVSPDERKVIKKLYKNNCNSLRFA